MLQIGKYRVFHQGGRWLVTHGLGVIVSEHAHKWAAIQAAREQSWCDMHEKRPPTPSVGGPKEPSSKWRRAI